VRVRYRQGCEKAGRQDVETIDIPGRVTLRGLYEGVRRTESIRAWPQLDRGFARAVNHGIHGLERESLQTGTNRFITPVSAGFHGVGVLFELTPDPLDARRLEEPFSPKGRLGGDLHSHRRRA